MVIQDPSFLTTAIIGCGYVADFYTNNAVAYPNMPIQGAFDVSEKRLIEFCDYHSLNAYGTIQRDRIFSVCYRSCLPHEHAGLDCEVF